MTYTKIKVGNCPAMPFTNKEKAKRLAAKLNKKPGYNTYIAKAGGVYFVVNKGQIKKMR